MTVPVIDAAESPDVQRTLARVRTHTSGSVGSYEPLLIRDGDRLFAVFEVTHTSWPIDDEMVRLGTSPQFLALIEHARRQPDEIPADQVAQLLEITGEERTAMRARRRRARKT